VNLTLQGPPDTTVRRLASITERPLRACTTHSRFGESNRWFKLRTAGKWRLELVDQRLSSLWFMTTWVSPTMMISWPGRWIDLYYLYESDDRVLSQIEYLQSKRMKPFHILIITPSSLAKSFKPSTADRGEYKSPHILWQSFEIFRIFRMNSWFPQFSPYLEFFKTFAQTS